MCYSQLTKLLLLLHWIGKRCNEIRRIKHFLGPLSILFFFCILQELQFEYTWISILRHSLCFPRICYSNEIKFLLQKWISEEPIARDSQIFDSHRFRLRQPRYGNGRRIPLLIHSPERGKRIIQVKIKTIATCSKIILGYPFFHFTYSELGLQIFRYGSRFASCFCIRFARSLLQPLKNDL